MPKCGQHEKHSMSQQYNQQNLFPNIFFFNFFFFKEIKEKLNGQNGQYSLQQTRMK